MSYPGAWILATIILSACAQQPARLSVDFAAAPRNLTHFWRGCGFTPGSLLLGQDEQENMWYAGSVPHQGIFFVRIHSLLDLIKGSGFDTDRPKYDWTQLDEAMSVQLKAKLHPHFELMGNPSGWWNNFEDKTQVYAWRQLVRDVARRYIQQYGIEQVRMWNFEGWNEPDIDGFMSKQSVQGYNNYWDACSEGLKDADPTLIFGGPATAHLMADRFVQLIEHCDNGTNYFTGETGVRVDFISIHNKGGSQSMPVTRDDLTALSWLRSEHPKFATTPFQNDEGDPQEGWCHRYEWRQDARYPAIATKIINQHLDFVIDNTTFDPPVNYQLLENDDAFMDDGSFMMRTLTTRFSPQNFPDTNCTNYAVTVFDTVKKPMLNLMTMLSLLGDLRYPVNGVGPADTANVGAFATVEADGLENTASILVYNSDDTQNVTLATEVELKLMNLPAAFRSGSMLVHYRIDNNLSTPFPYWLQIGAPRVPSLDQLQILWTKHELARIDGPTAIDPTQGVQYNFTLPLPGISLVHICAPGDYPPMNISGVAVHPRDPATTLHGQTENLVVWHTADSKCILTYNVLYASTASGPYARVNPVDLLTGLYMHVAGETGGFYSIQAVDVWGRAGAASSPVQAKTSI